MAPSDSIGIVGGGGAGSCFQPSVLYSSDARNRAAAGSDGGVFVGPQCLLGPDGTPIAPEGSGCVKLPAACILDYNGNPIAPIDGCVQLPAAGVPPAFGCGLATEEDGTLIAATTGTWPGDDLLGQAFEGASTEGSEIFCDEDGKLRGAPQGTAITTGSAAQVFPPDLQAFDAAFSTPSGALVTVTNPSLARSMMVARTMTASIDAVIPPDGAAVLRLQERIDGGAWSTVRSASPAEPDGGSVNLRATTTITWQRASVIAPGGSQTLELRAQVEKTGGGSSDPILVEVNVASRLIGVSQ